jgi:endoglucanase
MRYLKGVKKVRMPKVVAVIRERTVAAARMLVERTRANPYHVSLRPKDFVWGSNGIAAEYGICLLIANIFQPDASFVDGARDNLHYLLGRNTFSLSWVTQLGEHPFQHPHHRPSGRSAQGHPWPGLLSGGPNRTGKTRSWLLFRGPAAGENLRRTEASYASNEICINWQASLVFLLAGELQ